MHEKLDKARSLRGRIADQPGRGGVSGNCFWAVALPFGIFVAFIIARGILGPLRKTVEMIREMEKGHLQHRLQLNRADEIGQMGKAMDDFADSLQQEVVGSLDMLSRGDLTFKVAPRDSRDTIRSSLKKVGEDLTRLVSQVQGASQNVSAGAQAISARPTTMRMTL